MPAKDHGDLGVYRLAFASAIQIHELTKSFPDEELSHADAEAAETLVWLDFALHFGCLSRALHQELADHYDHICRQLALMMAEPQKWMPGGH